MASNGIIKERGAGRREEGREEENEEKEWRERRREEGRREGGGREERKEGDQEKGEKNCVAMAARRQNGLTKINVSPDMFGGSQFKILGSTELVPSEAGGGLFLASLPCLSRIVLWVPSSRVCSLPPSKDANYIGSGLTLTNHIPLFVGLSLSTWMCWGPGAQESEEGTSITLNNLPPALINSQRQLENLLIVRRKNHPIQSRVNHSQYFDTIFFSVSFFW